MRTNYLRMLWQSLANQYASKNWFLEHYKVTEEERKEILNESK